MKNTDQNTLKAAFWDYPELANKERLKEILESDEKPGWNDWILTRLLEYSRVVDTLDLITISEIKKMVPVLKLRVETRRKWYRMIEVYDAN